VEFAGQPEGCFSGAVGEVFHRAGASPVCGHRVEPIVLVCVGVGEGVRDECLLGYRSAGDR